LGNLLGSRQRRDLVAKYGSDEEGPFNVLSRATRPESYKPIKRTFDIEEVE